MIFSLSIIFGRERKGFSANSGFSEFPYDGTSGEQFRCGFIAVPSMLGSATMEIVNVMPKIEQEMSVKGSPGTWQAGNTIRDMTDVCSFTVKEQENDCLFNWRFKNIHETFSIVYFRISFSHRNFQIRNMS